MIAELYSQIASVDGVTVYDTKLPDVGTDAGDALASALSSGQAVVVVSFLPDVPELDVATNISGTTQRITLDVQALDIGVARATREALIAALNGWSGAVISSCVLELRGPEGWDWELVPPRYAVLVDFMITQ